MSAGSECVVELYLDEVWTDISAYLRADPGVEIQFGIRGEAGIADPATCQLVVNNRDGRFTPKNAVGAWYGLIKRGVPLRVAVDTVVRFIGEINELPPRWEPAEGDIWTPITASGPLRRLLRSNALSSTLYSFLSTLGVDDGGTVVGYWPMEDGPDSTVFASGLAGGATMFYTGTPGFAEIDGGPASGPIAKFAGVAAAQYLPASDDEFTIGFLLNMPSGGTADEASIAKWTTNGTANLWEISYEGGGLLNLSAWTGGGATNVLNQDVNLVLDGNLRWINLEVQQNGANVDWAFGASEIGTATGTINSVTVTSPSLIVMGAGPTAITGDVGIGHLVVSNSNTTLFTYDFNEALIAYAGESVEARMERIGDLMGTNVTVDDDGAVSTYLGAQPDGSPLGVIRDAEAADAGGIFRDSINTLNSTVFITRRKMYNDATPNLELDYAAGHLSPPLEPTDDDQLLANDVTVTRTGGSSARAVDTTGPLNSQSWPDGIGTYEKSSTLNVYSDTVLPAMAGWFLSRGTIDETRFPRITVDLTTNPSLVAAMDTVRPGGLVTIENLPAWVGGAGLVVLHCLGWTERITPAQRIIELNCTPASPFDVVRLDDEIFARLDSSTTTTNEALDTTETGVDYTGGEWITTATHPTEFPFNILIGGEEMTVTSATASVFTVTRSVNGVVKSHLTGQPVHVARPMRVAL